MSEKTTGKISQFVSLLKLQQVKKGFTFIELIIIFTIIFVMTAVMMTASYKGRDKKEIQAVAREVTASIREAQNNALTGKQKGNDTLSCAFKWGLVTEDVTDAGKYHAYQIFYSGRKLDENCPPDDNVGVSTPFFGSVQLPKGVTISALAMDSNTNNGVSKNHMIFRVPYGKFIIDDGGEMASGTEYTGMDIVIEKDGKKYHICVHSTGLMEEIGFNENDFACSF